MPTSCRPGRPEGLRYTRLWLTLGLGLAAAAAPLAQQPRHFALDTAGGVAAHGVVVTPDTLQGKPGLKVVASPEAMRQDAAETLATLNDVEFGNGDDRGGDRRRPRAGRAGRRARVRGHRIPRAAGSAHV